jgi:hypothetical protein
LPSACWINDVQAERRRLEARLRNLSAETAADFATADEIRRAVEELGEGRGLPRAGVRPSWSLS